MFEELTAAQLTGWMAFEELEPWGWTAENLQGAYTRSTLANTVRSSKAKAFEIKDFLINLDPAPKKKGGVGARLKAWFGVPTKEKPKNGDDRPVHP